MISWQLRTLAVTSGGAASLWIVVEKMGWTCWFFDVEMSIVWKHTDAEASLPANAGGASVRGNVPILVTRPGRKSLCRCSGQLGFRRVLCRWSTWIPKSHSDSEELTRDHMQIRGLPNEFVDSQRLDSVWCLSGTLFQSSYRLSKKVT